MNKFVSFLLGPLIGWPLVLTIDLIISFLYDININYSNIFNIFNEYTGLIILILLPIAYYFLLYKIKDQKQKIYHSLLFGLGYLVGGIYIFINSLCSISLKGCSFSEIYPILILGLGIYLGCWIGVLVYHIRKNWKER